MERFLLSQGISISLLPDHTHLLALSVSLLALHTCPSYSSSLSLPTPPVIPSHTCFYTNNTNSDFCHDFFILCSNYKPTRHPNSVSHTTLLPPRLVRSSDARLILLYYHRHCHSFALFPTGFIMYLANVLLSISLHWPILAVSRQLSVWLRFDLWQPSALPTGSISLNTPYRATLLLSSPVCSLL